MGPNCEQKRERVREQQNAIPLFLLLFSFSFSIYFLVRITICAQTQHAGTPLITEIFSPYILLQYINELLREVPHKLQYVHIPVHEFGATCS